MLALLASAALPGFSQMDEYSIKAGYVYNFTKYVDWPNDAFAGPSASFVICIAGEDPFAGRLEQAVSGKVSGDGRPLEVKPVNASQRDALRQCRILFLSRSEKSRAAEIVNALKYTPTLTVADFDSFAAGGGIADLRVEGTRVKVDLNVDAANRASLKVSARLQQVANLVR